VAVSRSPSWILLSMISLISMVFVVISPFASDFTNLGLFLSSF
jgi:hypothetical protein